VPGIVEELVFQAETGQTSSFFFSLEMHILLTPSLLAAAADYLEEFLFSFETFMSFDDLLRELQKMLVYFGFNERKQKK